MRCWPIPCGGDELLEVTAVDSRAEVLSAARLARPKLDRVQRLRLALVDPERLPYQNETFDVGHASLVVHHLDEDEAVRFLAELGRVSRRGIVVNDLHRGRLGLLGAWLAGRFLTRNRYTRDDSLLSVRRAWTLAEVEGLLRRAGLEPVDRRTAAFGQRYAVVAVRSRRGPAAAPVTGPDVAIVGGGPAGAIVASLLARAGHDVTVFERSPAYRWRACGVFASPATVAALRRVGLDEATLARVARPIPAMRVETPTGIAFRLPYGDGEPVGFDRSALDPALLDEARAAGATVCTGARVEAVDLDGPRPVLQVRTAGGLERHTARLVVGADGGNSIVARAAGVARPARLAPRVGLTFHLEDRPGDPVADARMRVFRDGYVGVAPVPGGRVNVGIVLGRSWGPRLAADGAEAVAEEVVSGIPVLDGAAGSPPDPAAWRTGARLDRVAGASPLGHRVNRRAGTTWLVVGDAAGFLDPFTGEGLHRAVVSAELGATCRRRGPPRRSAGAPRLRPSHAPPVRRQGRGVVARAGVPRAARPVRVRRPPDRGPNRRP